MLESYSVLKNGNRKLSEHFKVREFFCRDGSDPVFIDTELEILEKIRVHFDKPVTITSAYRTAAYNATVAKAAKYSQHLYGNTMNFNITAGTIARTAVLLLALTNQLLSAMGKSPLPIESTTVEQLMTAGITSIAALIAWWKNNSFTKEAIAADAEYDRLRKQNGK